MPASDLQMTSSLKDHFEETYTAYFMRMCRFAAVYLQDETEAEDLVQDVFLTIWQKREYLEVNVSLMAWLCSLVKNRCIDHLRHQMIVRNFELEYKLKLEALEKFDPPMEDEPGLEAAINRAIDTLPERCQVVFRKSRFEGKSNKEIAEELQISVSTVEGQMNTALRKLRIELKDYLPLLMLFGYL